MIALDSLMFTPRLRVDPDSRCAALGLPRDSIAILPFYRSTEEMEGPEQQEIHVHK
jgi:cleavage and polyadenylation specificity factor subunit 1